VTQRAVFYVLELSSHSSHPSFSRLSMGLEKVPFMIDWENRFAVRVTSNTKEACFLIESGFEYVTGEQSDGGKIFRKRK